MSCLPSTVQGGTSKVCSQPRPKCSQQPGWNLEAHREEGTAAAEVEERQHDRSRRSRGVSSPRAATGRALWRYTKNTRNAKLVERRRIDQKVDSVKIKTGLCRSDEDVDVDGEGKLALRRSDALDGRRHRPSKRRAQPPSHVTPSPSFPPCFTPTQSQSQSQTRHSTKQMIASMFVLYYAVRSFS